MYLLVRNRLSCNYYNDSDDYNSCCDRIWNVKIDLTCLTVNISVCESFSRLIRSVIFYCYDQILSSKLNIVKLFYLKIK